MTNLGYIKRMSVDNFKSQNRGGKGIRGMQTIEEDYIEDLFMTTTHHYIMFFTNTGRVYRLKAYSIPEAGRTARGTAIVNLLQMLPGEKITAVIPMKEYDNDKFLFMATKDGMVKKTPMVEYENVRKNGLQAIVLRENDELIEVSMQIDSQGDCLLVVSEKGMGKRTLIDEFKAQKRGGRGVLCYKITEKTGAIIGAKLVHDDRDIMLITTDGIIIRLSVDDISIIGRNTSGVKLMNIDQDTDITVASIAKVRESKSSDDAEDEEREGDSSYNESEENAESAGE